MHYSAHTDRICAKDDSTIVVSDSSALFALLDANHPTSSNEDSAAMFHKFLETVVF